MKWVDKAPKKEEDKGKVAVEPEAKEEPKAKEEKKAKE